MSPNHPELFLSSCGQRLGCPGKPTAESEAPKYWLSGAIDEKNKKSTVLERSQSSANGGRRSPPRARTEPPRDIGGHRRSRAQRGHRRGETWVESAESDRRGSGQDASVTAFSAECMEGLGA